MSGRERLEDSRAGISIGNISVRRPAGEWTPAVHSFLNYLGDSCGLNVAPVMQSEVSRLRLRDDEILLKIQVFIDEYGIDVTMGEVLDAMVRRIERLIEFMKRQASNGSAHFSKNIEDGHILEYETDIKLIQRLKKLA